MRRPLRLVPLLVLAVLVLAGCVSGEPKVDVAAQVPADQAEALAAEAEGATEGAGGGGDASSLRFVAIDLAYSEAPATAPAGDLTWALDNQGAAVHNVVIEELGDTLVVEAPGGEQATGRQSLEAGTYTYYCSIPGHRGAGMEGTLEVQ